MPTHQIHIARTDGLSDRDAVTRAIEEYRKDQNAACPFIVIAQANIVQANDTTDPVILVDLIAQVSTSIRQIDMPDAGCPTIKENYVLKAVPFSMQITADRLETTGGAKTLDMATDFMLNDLGLSFLWNKIDLPILDAIDKLKSHDGFRGARRSTVKDYCHNSYTTGKYAAEFLDAEHGDVFMQEYHAGIAVADVRMQIDGQPAIIRLTGTSSFAYTAKPDANIEMIKNVCRAVAGWTNVPNG